MIGEHRGDIPLKKRSTPDERERFARRIAVPPLDERAQAEQLELAAPLQRELAQRFLPLRSP